MIKDWMRRIKVLNKSREGSPSANVKNFLQSSVSVTSLHHNIEKRPTPMPFHCCTGMTIDEWADVKNKEHTTTVMTMPIVAR